MKYFEDITTKQLVKNILLRAKEYELSLQGFGMLRLHLSDEVRLNIWNSEFRVPNVSLMHTHPWNFDSKIIVGSLENIIFFSPQNGQGESYEYALVRPGPGGGLKENKGICKLDILSKENLSEGDSYNQDYNEIHISNPIDGTVTLNVRERVGEDVAYLFWPAGTNWVSAEPRKANCEEIDKFVSSSLKLF